MKGLIRKYREKPFEDRLVLRATLGLCFSAVLTTGKFVIGILTDVNLCIIAVYTCAILLAKLQCVRGAKGSAPARRNVLTAVFLLFASVVYSAFMGSMAFTRRSHGDYSLIYVLFLATIAFCELGFSIAGIFRTADRGYQYLDIKIIDFCIAAIALLTAQIAILNYTTVPDVDMYNSFVGMGVGILIAVCAVYILIAPRVGIVGRERQTFILRDGEKNDLIDMKKTAVTLMLCRSAVYGSYIYTAEIRGPFLDGKIGRTATLWKRMPVALKVVCCILSEILVFVWLFGSAVFFFRSMNLPKKLQKKLECCGFEQIAESQISVPYSA